MSGCRWLRSCGGHFCGHAGSDAEAQAKLRQSTPDCSRSSRPVLTPRGEHAPGRRSAYGHDTGSARYWVVAYRCDPASAAMRSSSSAWAARTSSRHYRRPAWHGAGRRALGRTRPSEPALSAIGKKHRHVVHWRHRDVFRSDERVEEGALEDPPGATGCVGRNAIQLALGRRARHRHHRRPARQGRPTAFWPRAERHRPRSRAGRDIPVQCVLRCSGSPRPNDRDAFLLSCTDIGPDRSGSPTGLRPEPRSGHRLVRDWDQVGEGARALLSRRSHGKAVVNVIPPHRLPPASAPVFDRQVA